MNEEACESSGSKLTDNARVGHTRADRAKKTSGTRVPGVGGSLVTGRLFTPEYRAFGSQARHSGELCPTRLCLPGSDGKNQKGAPVSRSALKLKGIVAHYLMPEVLVLLADLALGSRLSRPSVADTATSDPSRRARTTGK